MKIFKISVISFVLLFIFSCVKDEDRVLLNYDGKVVFICSDMEQVETKTTLSGIITNWVGGVDQVGVYSPEAKSGAASLPGVSNTPFTAQTSSSSSKFTGSIYWGSGQHTFYSYYPYTAGSFAETAVPVSLPPSQTQENGDDNSHIGAIDFMVARPQSTAFPGLNGATAAVSLRYEHLFTLLEFKIIRVGTIGSISKLRLKGSIPLAFNSGTVDITQNTPSTGQPYTLALDDSSNEVIVTLTNPVTPTSDYTTTPSIFMMVLPGDHTGNLKIGIESGGEWREISKTGTNFLRGKKYTVQVDADAAEIPVLTMADLPEVTIGTTTWANTNLGYDESHTYGLFYQWHRKGGIPYLGVETSSIDVIQGPISFEEGSSMDNYGKFVYCNTSPYDWTDEQQISWNMYSDFNPCPTGWRLPTKTEVQDLINTGRTWAISPNLGVEGMLGSWFGPNNSDQNIRQTTALFFPANGRIQYSSSNASPLNRDSQGFYLTDGLNGTTNTAKVNVLYFTGTSLNVGSLERSAAGSIRCVKSSNNTLPSIRTYAANAIRYNSIEIGGNIESEGTSSVIQRGFVYNTSPAPTISNNKVVDTAVGLGSFNMTISSLNPYTYYYIRAFATNSSGTVYGNEYKILTYPSLLKDMSPIEINGVKWAPVNAGYDETYKYGMLYQWSRKYGQDYLTTPPFYTTVRTVSVVNGDGLMKYFFKIATSPFDCCSPQVISWDMNLYNPCPTGWRVPSEEEFTSLINSGYSGVVTNDGMKGRWFGGDYNGDHSGSIFIPFGGYRTASSGTSSTRDSFGLYWTSNISGVDAIYVFFEYTNTPCSSVGSRGHGASVRCVKE